MDKSWVTGERGGRYYIAAGGKKVYGKEGVESKPITAYPNRDLNPVTSSTPEHPLHPVGNAGPREMAAYHRGAAAHWAARGEPTVARGHEALAEKHEKRAARATKDFAEKPDVLSQLAAARKGVVKIPESLGIPRAEMPQIRAIDVPEFLESLKAKGIKVESLPQRVGDLKPTQAELNMEKVAAMKGMPSIQEKPIITSRDGYILDGHHRWAGIFLDNKEHTIPTYKVDLPMKELLTTAAAFPKAMRQEASEIGPTTKVVKAA